MKCNGDCFNCIYEDCTNEVDPAYVDRLNELQRKYHKKWRSEHLEESRAYAREWRKAHADSINAKNRVERMQKRTCTICKKKLIKQESVLKYHRQYFCGLYCVKEFMLKQAIERQELKTVQVPTMEGKFEKIQVYSTK